MHRALLPSRWRVKFIILLFFQKKKHGPKITVLGSDVLSFLCCFVDDFAVYFLFLISMPYYFARFRGSA